MNKVPEEVSSLLDSSLEKVVQTVFQNCDRDNIGRVSVSKILKFIEPFLKEQPTILIDLKQILDPNETDPLIDVDTVNNAMIEWSGKLKESFNADVNASINQTKDIKCDPIGASTPSKGPSRYKLMPAQNNVEFLFSFCDMPKATNQTQFEEQMKDLLFQYRKLKDEVDNARSQQTVFEETNEKWLNEIKDLQAQILRNKNTIKELRNEIRDYEEVTELLDKEKTEKRLLQQLLERSEKEINIMKIDYDNLELENKNLEKKYEKLILDHKEYLKVIGELEAVVDIRDAEVVVLKSQIQQLQIKINEQNENFRIISDDNEKLKTQKSTVEKHLRKSLNKVATSSLIPQLSITTKNVSRRKSEASCEFDPPFETKNFSFYNYEAPVARINSNKSRHSIACPTQAAIIHEFQKFNSPRLLRNLDRPLSPLLTSPPENFLELIEAEKDISLCKSFEQPTKLYELDPKRLSLASNRSICSDTQISFTDDDLQWQMGLLENSGFISLHTELMQANNQSMPLDTYENTIKQLMQEISSLKDQLTEKNNSMSNPNEQKVDQQTSTTELFDAENFREKYETAFQETQYLQLELSMAHFRLVELDEENISIKESLLKIQKSDSFRLGSTCDLSSLSDDEEIALIHPSNRLNKKRLNFDKKISTGKLQIKNERLMEKFEMTAQKLIDEEIKSKLYLQNMNDLKNQLKVLEDSNVDLNLKLDTLSKEKEKQIFELEQKIEHFSDEGTNLLDIVNRRGLEILRIEEENHVFSLKCEKLMADLSEMSKKYKVELSKNSSKNIGNSIRKLFKIFVIFGLVAIFIVIIFGIRKNLKEVQKGCRMRIPNIQTTIMDIVNTFFGTTEYEAVPRI